MNPALYDEILRSAQDTPLSGRNCGAALRAGFFGISRQRLNRWYMFDETYDRGKSQRTKETRGIDFVEARAIWADPHAIEGPATIKDGEERWLKIGRIAGRIWAVGFTHRLAGIRIFMVRPAREFEREVYDAP